MRLDLAIEKSAFAAQLSQEVAASGVTVVDAVENLFSEWLEDSILKSLGERIINAPRAIVHPTYYTNRFQNLAPLSQNGYFTWYPEIRFSTRNNDHLEIDDVETSGFDLTSIRYGGGIDRPYLYRRKELKTQVNHIIRLNKVTIPSHVFEQTICDVNKLDRIDQPYIANLTVGCEHYTDDRIEGFRTVAFDHVVTGERKFCRCHSNAHAAMLSDAKARAHSFVPDSWPHRVIGLLEHAVYADCLCHFCVSERHGQDAPIEWYGAQVQKHFEPYVDLLVRSTDIDLRTARAEARRRLSISRWLREDDLYQLVSRLFPTKTVRREASPAWLGQQRLDIYFPELALAIEHQGEQHYYPIEVFGGEQAFVKTQERDERKRALCRRNGVTVIEIRFDDPLTIPSLRFRLRRWLID